MSIVRRNGDCYIPYYTVHVLCYFFLSVFLKYSFKKMKVRPLSYKAKQMFKFFCSFSFLSFPCLWLIIPHPSLAFVLFIPVPYCLFFSLYLFFPLCSHIVPFFPAQTYLPTFPAFFSPSPLVNGSRHRGRSVVAFAKAIVVSMCLSAQYKRLCVCLSVVRFTFVSVHICTFWGHKSRALF